MGFARYSSKNSVMKPTGYICGKTTIMNNITLQTIVSRRQEGLLVSELGKELVMMDIENGNYIGLNETGKAIWDLIQEPIKVEELIQRLLTQYDISAEQCSSDTVEYLAKMQEQQILATG